jgi:hypothetical protein
VNDKIYFHIGMHKTATTWFQRHIFSRLPGIKFIMSRRLDEIGKASGKAPKLLISHESLSGTLSTEKQPGDNKKRLAESLSRIAAMRPDASIIVGFREHASWLGAAYMHKAKTQRLDFERYAETYSRDDLSWCGSLDIIEGTSSSIFPFLYEELVETPEALIRDLCTFLGTEPPQDLDKLLKKRENPSPRSGFGQSISRAFHRLSYGLDRIMPMSTRPLRQLGAHLGSRFDDEEAPRQAPLEPELAQALRQDWKEVVVRVGRHRGRDLSAFLPKGWNEG